MGLTEECGNCLISRGRGWMTKPMFFLDKTAIMLSNCIYDVNGKCNFFTSSLDFSWCILYNDVRRIVC